MPVAPGRIIAGDNKIGAGVPPFAVLELADDTIELDTEELALDAVELSMDELAIDEAILVIDELELELGADDDGALLLDIPLYSIGNKGFP